MMEKAIFYKEWIKTRYFFLLALAVSLCFTGYALLRVNRVVEFKGAGHLWEILLQKDMVFIEVLQYVPLFIGVLLGVVQFVPEMLQKRLKLTLHLPYPQQRMILLMLFFGMALLAGIFVLNYLFLGVYLNGVLAPELTGRILLTSLPWFLAGLPGYLFTAWICLEPAWKMSVVHVLVAAGVLRIFFLSDMPQAYDGMICILLLLAFLAIAFPLLSVRRFKEGRQD